MATVAFMKKFMAAIAVLLCSSLVVACGDSDAETLTVYSGRSEELVQPIIDQFIEASGIDVQVKYGDSADLALLIEQEGDATPADVFISQSPGAIGFLESSAALDTIPSAVLELVPASVRDDDGLWVGITGRQRVLVYNPALVDESELPSSVFELTNSAWDGRLAIAPANGSFQDFVTAMRATAGESETEVWLQGLVANNVASYPKNSAIVAAVGSGEIDAGLVNHYYNFRALAEDPKHRGLNHQLASDDPGSVLIITGAAMTKGSEDKTSAEEFLTYLLSPEAQSYFANETFEYPLTPGVDPASAIPPASFAAVGGIEFNGLGGGLSATRDLIVSVGLEG
jgi:iron(III) transport system substrate-binding protein